MTWKKWAIYSIGRIARQNRGFPNPLAFWECHFFFKIIIKGLKPPLQIPGGIKLPASQVQRLSRALTFAWFPSPSSSAKVKFSSGPVLSCHSWLLPSSSPASYHARHYSLILFSKQLLHLFMHAVVGGVRASGWLSLKIGRSQKGSVVLSKPAQEHASKLCQTRF